MTSPVQKIFVLAALIAAASCSRIRGLEVDHLAKPQAVGSSETVFSWSFDKEDGFRQSKCRVAVKGVWDSGEISSRETRLILPEDVLLGSLRKYRWTLEVWDADGHRRMARSSFRTALYPEGNWTARWIGPARPGVSQPVFRKEFRVGKGLRRATLCVSSTGGNTVTLGGETLGGAYSIPTSLYGEIAGQYRIYDVTKLLKSGLNTLTAQVVATQPAIIAELHLFYKDGSHDRICTDESWEASLGSRYTRILEGIQFDASEDSLSWAPALFSDKGYQLLIPDESPLPARKRMLPLEEKQGDTLKTFDFGQTIRANCTVDASGKEGDIVELRYFDGSRIATDRLILGRRGRARWTDAFSERSFRSVTAVYPSGTRVKIQADVVGPSDLRWPALRGLVEGFILDPAPSSAPFAAVDTLFTRYADRSTLSKAWPALESYLAGTRRKSLEEYTLMEKFAIALGQDATPYSETRRIMTGK